jgi:hypothetical protein
LAASSFSFFTVLFAPATLAVFFVFPVVSAFAVVLRIAMAASFLSRSVDGYFIRSLNFLFCD